MWRGEASAGTAFWNRRRLLPAGKWPGPLALAMIRCNSLPKIRLRIFALFMTRLRNMRRVIQPQMKKVRPRLVHNFIEVLLSMKGMLPVFLVHTYPGRIISILQAENGGEYKNDLYFTVLP